MYRLTPKGEKFLAPGRGVLHAAPVKLPTPRSAFTALSKEYGTGIPAHDTLEGPPALVAAAQRTREALRSGTLPTRFQADEAAMVWRLLSDHWSSAYSGLPAQLNKGRQHAVKIARYWVATGGAVGAVDAVAQALLIEPAARERVVRFDPPGHPAYDQDPVYQLKFSPVHELLRHLRHLLAQVPEDAYRAAAARVAAHVQDMPLHLRVALGFLVPTERTLARAALADLCALTAYPPQPWPGRRTASALTLAHEWPCWTADLAWCLETPEDFAPLFAKSIGGSWHTQHLCVAALSICPEAVPPRLIAYPMVYDGLLLQ